MPGRPLATRLIGRFRRRRAPVSPDPGPLPVAVASPPVSAVVDLGPVDRWGEALWAGLTAVARPALEALADSVDEPPQVVSAAAHHLAAWALVHADPTVADRWVERLDITRPDQCVVAALAAHRTGDGGRATAWLDAAIAQHPDDVHLRLHRAALGSMADRVEVLDALLVEAGCQSVLGGAAVASFPDLPVTPSRRAPRESVDPGVTPLVTVIVPAYRAGGTIGHAVASLQAQTYTNLQIIVVDDDSGDATPDLVRQLARDDVRLSLVRQPTNRGTYAARNAGLDRATGALVTVLDADDWAHPQRIERQVRHLMAHPDVVANATHLVRVDHELRCQPHGRHPYKVLGKNTASLMVRREVVGVVGPWDSGVRGGADFEFLKRLEARFGAPAVAHVLRRAPLTLSLRHQASLTSASATGMASLWHVYGARRQYLDAFTAWHRSERFPRDLPLRADGPRMFAAPAVLAGTTGSSFVDVVVRGDLSPGASGVGDAVTQVVRAAGAGRSLALWHEPHDVASLDAGLDLAIVRLLADQRARLLSAGEQVRCQNLIRVGRPSALGLVDGAPEVTVVPW